MTTTQTQETGPVDDAIDQMVIDYGFAILDCNDTFVYEGSPEFDAAEKKARDIGMSITARLAERPNRAVARGDSVTVRQTCIDCENGIVFANDGKGLSYSGMDYCKHCNGTGKVKLTTPTETTDPAMESDDEQE